MKDKDSEILIEIIETAKPLLELILSKYLVNSKNLNKKQKKHIRNKPYVWGYINTLVDSISKSHIKDQLTNRHLSLLASHQIYELNKNEFAHGISECEFDLEKMKVKEPNKLPPLNGLNVYLLKKYKEINEI